MNGVDEGEISGFRTCSRTRLSTRVYDELIDWYAMLATGFPRNLLSLSISFPNTKDSLYVSFVVSSQNLRSSQPRRVGRRSLLTIVQFFNTDHRHTDIKHRERCKYQVERWSWVDPSILRDSGSRPVFWIREREGFWRLLLMCVIALRRVYLFLPAHEMTLAVRKCLWVRPSQGRRKIMHPKKRPHNILILILIIELATMSISIQKLPTNLVTAFHFHYFPSKSLFFLRFRWAKLTSSYHLLQVEWEPTLKKPNHVYHDHKMSRPLLPSPSERLNHWTSHDQAYSILTTPQKLSDIRTPTPKQHNTRFSFLCILYTRSSASGQHLTTWHKLIIPPILHAPAIEWTDAKMTRSRGLSSLSHPCWSCPTKNQPLPQL